MPETLALSQWLLGYGMLELANTLWENIVIFRWRAGGSKNPTSRSSFGVSGVSAEDDAESFLDWSELLFCMRLALNVIIFRRACTSVSFNSFKHCSLRNTTFSAPLLTLSPVSADLMRSFRTSCRVRAAGSLSGSKGELLGIHNFVCSSIKSYRRVSKQSLASFGRPCFAVCSIPKNVQDISRSKWFDALFPRQLWASSLAAKNLQ
jgi:hypothetical protein